MLQESVRVRRYRQQVTSQALLYPLQRKIRLKSDDTKSRTLYGSLVSCNTRTIDRSIPEVFISGFVDGKDTVLFSVPEKLWQCIHANASLVSLFDAAIVGAPAAAVPARVASVIADAAALYRERKVRGKLVIEHDEYRDLRKFAESPFVSVAATTATGIVTGWFPTGLRYCGNSFVCPVCSERKAWKQRQRLQAAIDTAYGNNLLPMMLTFTHSHKAGDSCSDGFAVMSAALVAFRKTAAYKAFVSSCASTFNGKPFLPSFLSTEVVLGKIFYDKYKADVLSEAAKCKQQARQLSLFNPFAGDDTVDADNPADCADFFKSHNINDFCNGWHVHKHGLFFIRKDSYKAYVSLIPQLKAAWSSAVVTVTQKILGRTLSARSIGFLNAEGLSCSLTASSTSIYVCKHDKQQRAWGAEDELTRSTAKYRGGLSPFTLLDNPTPFHAALWREYVTSCRGQQRYQTNKGFDAFFEALRFRQEQRQRQQRWQLSLSDLRTSATTTLIPWRVTIADISAIFRSSLDSPNLDARGYRIFGSLVSDRVRVKAFPKLGIIKLTIESEKPLNGSGFSFPSSVRKDVLGINTANFYTSGFP